MASNNTVADNPNNVQIYLLGAMYWTHSSLHIHSFMCLGNYSDLSHLSPPVFNFAELGLGDLQLQESPTTLCMDQENNYTLSKGIRLGSHMWMSLMVVHCFSNLLLLDDCESSYLCRKLILNYQCEECGCP